MAAQPLGNTPGSGVGVSGPALGGAGEPRPQPSAASYINGSKDGPPRQELAAAWMAYTGRFNAKLNEDDNSLAPQFGVPDLNVKSNRIRPIVDTGVDYLFGPPLEIAVENAQAQKILDALWGDADKQMTLLAKTGMNGGVYGHVFMKVVPPKRGRPSAINPPRLVLLNPETVCIETDPDDAELVVKFIIEYACNDSQGNPMRKRQTITRLDPDQDDDSTAEGVDSDTTWEIQDWEASGSIGNNWREVGPPREWAYELPPIADWQNFPNPNSHWGQRDVTDSLIALNRQLRLVESNINKIGYTQGHPILYSVNADTGSIKPTPGQIVDLGGEDAKIEAVSAQGNLQPLMDFADVIRADMDEESGIPGIALGRMKDLPRGQVSGISMRLLHASALARTEHKRRLYGQGIRQVCQTALLLCGMSMDEVDALDIKLTWQDPLPTDDFAEAQAWQIKVSNLGYSQTTAIEETGGNPDLEEERKQDEQQAQVTAFSQGKGLPPMPTMPPQMMNDTGRSDQQPPAPAQDAPGASGAGGNAPPVNHPAAILQRARMAATAKS